MMPTSVFSPQENSADDGSGTRVVIFEPNGAAKHSNFSPFPKTTGQNSPDIGTTLAQVDENKIPGFSQRFGAAISNQLSTYKNIGELDKDPKINDMVTTLSQTSGRRELSSKRPAFPRRLSLDSVPSIAEARPRPRRSSSSYEILRRRREMFHAFATTEDAGKDFQPKVPTRYSIGSSTFASPEQSRNRPALVSSLKNTTAQRASFSNEVNARAKRNSLVSALTNPSILRASFSESGPDRDNDAFSVVSGITNPGFYDDSSNIDDDEEDENSVSGLPRGVSEPAHVAAPEKKLEDGSRGTKKILFGQSRLELHHKALAKMADRFSKGVPIGVHKHHFKKYGNTFVGSEAIDYMVNSEMTGSREDAIFLAQRFVKELNLFHHVYWDHTFLKDDHLFYRFTENGIGEQSIAAASVSSSGHSHHSFQNTDSPGSDPPIIVTDLHLAAKKFQEIISVATHSFHLKNYRDTFVGSEAVDKMVAEGLTISRTDAVFLGQRLMDELNLFSHVKFNHMFKDSHLFYTFTETDKTLVDLSKSPAGRKNSTIRQMLTPRSARDSFSSISSHCSSLRRPASMFKRKWSEFTVQRASLQLPQRHEVTTSTSSPSCDGGIMVKQDTVEARMVAPPRIPVRNASIVSGMISNPESYVTDPDVASVASSAASRVGVSFGEMQIRIYERCLDINPATSSGPSIGLGWGYKDVASQLLADDGDDQKQTANRRRFILSKNQREAILENCGYSRKDISLATRQNTKAREKRRETLNKLSASSMASL